MTGGIAKLRPGAGAPHGAARSSQLGVALVEALVSTLIFAFGLLGLIGLTTRAINFSVSSEDRNRAAIFANDIASNMWLQGSVTASATTLSTWNTQVADPKGAGLPNGIVTITPVAGTTNSADIKIQWRPVTSDKTAPLNQLTTRVILP